MSREIQRYQEDWTLRQFLTENIADDMETYQRMLQDGISPGDESLFPKGVDRVAFLKGKIATLQEQLNLITWYEERKQAEAEESQSDFERDVDEVWETELR